MSEPEKEFSFKSIFVPFTTLKAIHWIIFIGLVIYFNALFNGFVWDDKSYILNNPDVHTILNFFNLFKTNLFNNAGQYRPLVAIYFSILYTLFGANAFFYHFIQLTIHILNSVLLFVFLGLFFDSAIAFLLAILFLVSPIQVESVSFIGAVASVINFLFGISALLLVKKKQLTNVSYIFLTMLLLLSLITKESGITFVIVVVLFEFLFKKAFKKPILYACISLVFYLFLRLIIGGVFLGTRMMWPISRLMLSQRIINIPKIFFYYLQTFLFPIHLSIDQQWIVSKPSLTGFYLPILFDVTFLVLITTFGLFIVKRFKDRFLPFVFFLVWFFAGIGIYLQIVPLDMTVADRWFYVPIVGLLGITGVALEIVRKSYKSLWKFTLVICIAVILLFSMRTIVRNSNWFNGITLYTHDRTYNDNFDIENNLATEYLDINNYPLALKAAKRSVGFFPIDMTLYNLGNSYEQSGEIQKAEKAYVTAIAAKDYVPWQHKHYLEIYIALSRIMVFFNSPLQAKQFILTALSDWPDSSDLWVLLAIAENKLYEKTDAIRAAQKAYEINPDITTTYVYHTLTNGRQLNLSYSKYGLKIIGQ